MSSIAEATSRPAPLVVLADGGEWIAIVKPARLAVIPGRDEADSVLQRLGRQLGLPSSGAGDPRVRVVHRLDKDTSGVLLMARTSAAQRWLSRQFQEGQVQKEYLALVAGRPTSDAGEIDAPIGPSPTDPRRMAVVKHAGRPARTQWKLERRFSRANLALLRVFPRTGKTHQIRVHLAHAGLPLAIDSLYGSRRGKPKGIFLSAFKRDYRPNRGQQEAPLIDRLTLHAESLAFTDPQGNPIRIECPLPKDFRATVNQLSRHGS